MKKNPEITVLMSVYNGEKYLHEAINSILNQTFEDYEFLIINDGSNDNTEEILQSYDDQRIRIVNNGKNIGLTKSLNKGLKIARGQYVARMDADDVSYPERLEMQYKHVNNDKNLAICASYHEEIDETGNLIETIKPNLEPEQLYYFLTFSNRFLHSSVLMRKDIISKVGGYDESIKRTQDYDLWYRVSRVAKINVIDKVLVKHRVHKESISLTYRDSQRHFASLIAFKNIEGIYKKCNWQVDPRILKMLSGEGDKETSFKGIDPNSFINSLIVLHNYLLEAAPEYINKKKLEKIYWRRIYNCIALALKKEKYSSIKNILCQNFMNKGFVTSYIKNSLSMS